MEEDSKDAGLSGDSASISNELKDVLQPPADTELNLPPGRSAGLSGALPSRTGHQCTSLSKDFEFVLGNDNQSRRQVRRHAMRQYTRQRRLDSIARLETSRTPIGGWVIRDNTKAFPADRPQIQAVFRESNLVGAKDEELAVVEQEIRSLPFVSTDRIKTENTSALNRLPDPLAVPGAGGIRDPFNSYPVVIGYADHELIQHCKYSSCIWNAWVAEIGKCSILPGRWLSWCNLETTLYLVSGLLYYGAYKKQIL